MKHAGPESLKRLSCLLEGLCGRAPLVETRAILALFVACGFFVGCDGDFVSAGPVAVCREAGRQCQRGDGPLGVCERTPCAGDRTAPCFVCTSQH
jgi:hypothetical protein